MDFAPDATPRMKVFYTSAGITHSMQVRSHRDSSPTIFILTAADYITAFVTALQSVLPTDFHFTSATYTPQDSDVSVPVGKPADPTGAIDPDDMSKQDKISHLTFRGKSSGGSKASIKVFGVQFSPDTAPPEVESDFIFSPGESTPLDNAVGVLAASTLLSAVDNNGIVWYDTVNLKVNDHYLRLARRGLIN